MDLTAMSNWLLAGGSSQKPANSCYAMTAANEIEMSNQMRTGETIDNASMDTDRLVSSFTVRKRICKGAITSKIKRAIKH